MSLIKMVPRSDATNVYDLLQDVKQAILEEPRRANMNYFGLEVGNNQSLMWIGPDDTYHKLQAPSCGTIGCFAGWVQMLSGVCADDATRFADFGAESILGRDLVYSFTDERNQTRSFFNWGAGDGLLEIKPQTRAYARAVVKRINRFIEVNGGKAVLKTKALGKPDYRYIGRYVPAPDPA